MTYAKIQDGIVVEYPVYEGDIKLLHPGTSFPFPFSPPEGYAPVVDTPQPQVGHDQVVAEGDLELVDGEWYRTWVVSEAPDSIVAERTQAQAKRIRSERNKRIAQCDWTQLPDASVDVAAWASYRQQLRDLPKQSGFPWLVTWPSEP
jgi:hypothetical protein